MSSINIKGLHQAPKGVFETCIFFPISLGLDNVKKNMPRKYLVTATCLAHGLATYYTHT